MADRSFMGLSPAIVDSALNEDAYSQFFNMPNSPEALDEDMISTSDKFTPDSRYPGLIIPAGGESSASPESFSQDSASDSSMRNHNRKTSSNSSFSNWRDVKRAASNEELEKAKHAESVRSEDVEMALPTYDSPFTFEIPSQFPLSHENRSLASPMPFSAPAPRRQTSAEGWGQFPSSDSTGRVNPFLDSLESYAQLRSPSMQSADHSISSPGGLLPCVLMRNPPPENWNSPAMFDAQSPFQTQSPVSARAVARSAAKYELRIADTPYKSRVETQIKIVLTLDNLPAGVTKLHLPAHTISKPKLLAKDDLQKSPDMLELHTALVCTSAVSESDVLEAALARARSGACDEDLAPQDGGEVRICPGCIQRERKRAARKKMKKVEEEEHWAKDEAKRVIVFNCPEVKEWQPAEGAAMSIEVPMRIACYCRHQSEKTGFRVIFTIKDHLDNHIAQGITHSIMITDDHKTHTTTSPTVAAMPEQRPVAKSQRRSDDFNTPKLFYGNSDHAMSPVSPPSHNVTTSSTPKTLSRQPSFSGPSGPSAKKRKTPSGHKVPNDLAMTRLETPTESGASSRTSSKAPSAATSPFHRMPHSFPTFDNMAFPSLTPFTPLTPNSNDMGLGMQPMDISKSAPSSNRPSRANSPSTAFRTLMGQPTDVAVERPRIHRIIPGEGPTSGAIEVTCLGRGFHKGLEVVFGANVATTTTFWGESTLVCLLPPAMHPGVVPVSFKDNSYTAVQSFATFKYVDNNERDLLRLALTVLGQKMTGKAEDAHEVALRIMGSTSSMWQSSVNDGSGSSMSGGQMEKDLVGLLDMIDRDDSEHEAELDTPNDSGLTMLHLASALGLYSFVSGLLSRGADPNVFDRGGYSPMHFAAMHGHVPVIRKLIQKGADPMAQNYKGITPDELTENQEVIDLTRAQHHVRRRSGNSNFSKSRNSSANSLVLSRNQSSTLLASMSRMSLNNADVEEDEESYEEDEPQLWMRPRPVSQHDEPSLWIKSRRGSMQQVSAEDLASQGQGPAHNALAAFREQLAAQLHFLQQLRLPQYQNYLPNNMGRLNSLIPGRGGNEMGDDKESRWWEMFSTAQSSAPPPAYDEIYPGGGSIGCDEDFDRKTQRASSVLSETSTSSSSSSSALNVSIGANFTSQQKAQLKQAHAKKLKKFGSDRKLFFVWIPLLLLVMVLMMRSYIPAAWHLGVAVCGSALSLAQGRMLQAEA